MKLALTRRLLLGAFSILSTAAALLVIALLMGSHTPFQTLQARSGVLARLTGRWQAVYILGSECPCSDRVARHLLTRPGLASIDERIVFIGNDRETPYSLKQRGWRVEHWSAERARDAFGAQSAPLLVFVDPAGEIRYSGGFARQSDFRDGFHESEIWNGLSAGLAIKPYPAYGCALRFGCALGGLAETADRLKGD